MTQRWRAEFEANEVTVEISTELQGDSHARDPAVAARVLATFAEIASDDGVMRGWWVPALHGPRPAGGPSTTGVPAMKWTLDGEEGAFFEALEGPSRGRCRGPQVRSGSGLRIIAGLLRDGRLEPVLMDTEEAS